MEFHVKLVAGVVRLRRSLLLCAGALLASSAAIFAVSPRLLAMLQAHLHQELAFYTVAEPFLAHAKLSFFAAIFLLMPLLLHVLWGALAAPFAIAPAARAAFTLATSGLFYAGASFCYLVTLPFGIDFLLGFGSDSLKPLISIERFAGFVSLFIVSFGLIFQLPVFMFFTARTGIFPRRRFEQHRRYAVLIISILAALLTPTPDVVNMALMGVPLYLLYEGGILAMRFSGID